MKYTTFRIFSFLIVVTDVHKIKVVLVGAKNQKFFIAIITKAHAYIHKYIHISA